MHYKIGVTCVYNRHAFQNSVLITEQSNPPISKFISVMNSRVSGQCPHAITSPDFLVFSRKVHAGQENLVVNIIKTGITRKDRV